MKGFKLPGIAWTLLLTIALPLIAALLTDQWGTQEWAVAIAGVLLTAAKIIEEYRKAMSLPAMPAGAAGESAPRRKRLDVQRMVWG